MKITVKTLKGAHFDITIAPSASVIEVKKMIEEMKGRDAFPYEQQLLIHQGKVLKDETSLEENNVKENSFVVIMLTNKKSAAQGPISSSSRAAVVTPSAAPSSAPPTTEPAPVPPPSAPVPAPLPASETHADTAQSPVPASPALAVTETQVGAGQPHPDMYGSLASTLVTGSVRESTVEEMLAMGGGQWDRDTVIRALTAAFNNPERAVEYLYSGIPEAPVQPDPVPAPPASTPVVPSPTAAPLPGPTPTPAPATRPPAEPLNLFPQVPPSGGEDARGGALDFLRTNPQFIGLRSMVQTTPQLLQPMLLELGRQNPQLLQLINAHPEEFMRLLSEGGAEEGEAGGMADMPHTLTVTEEEEAAIIRLESLGFPRALVIEAYFACDKNEQLAANYLLENARDFED